jgi:hypothetical protein
MASAFKVKLTHKAVKSYYTATAHEDFNKAVEEFKQRVPDLARGAWGESKAAPAEPSPIP